MKGKGVVSGTAKDPLRHLVAEWLVNIYMSIPAQAVRNALMKTGYKWF